MVVRERVEKDEVLYDRVRRNWDIEKPLPRPRFTPRCGTCGSTDIQVVQYHFFLRPESVHLYRCDVKMKCRDCSMVWIHGIAVPNSVFERHGETVYNTRQIRKLLGV